MCNENIVETQQYFLSEWQKSENNTNRKMKEKLFSM